MNELIEYIVKKLAKYPETFQLRCQESDRNIDFFLTLHPDDVGRVIGRQGRTIGAIRTLLNITANKRGKKATLEIENPSSPTTH
ncbi:MAG: KH domain-containing protein [Verrucomicrobiae bacterium]|nr:KH domain-containing protein [Verrucomicrobiae bacterium]